MSLLRVPATLRLTLFRVLALALVFYLVVFVALPPSAPSHSPRRLLRTSSSWLRLGASRHGRGARIAKVSMLYGARNDLYERAIQSHERHARHHGYPMYVLRRDISQGYWNKPMFIQAIIIQELCKPAEDRAEWVMWFDADSIIINPKIPLDIFLPPKEYSNIHFLGNKDHNGLNTGVFFLRVHEWSVRMLASVIAYPTAHPDHDLGCSADQQAMAIKFNETETAASVLYQPRIWYNTYEFRHGYEGSKGRLLVHFPGLEADRWPHMASWLDRIEKRPREWEQDLAHTMYPADVGAFWDELVRARSALIRAHDLHTQQQQQTPQAAQGQAAESKIYERIGQAAGHLDYVVKTESDRLEAVKEAREALEAVMHKQP